MKTIRLFDNCMFDGDTWQVIAQEGAILTLRSYNTGRVRHVGIAELLGDDSFEPESQTSLPILDDVAILETLAPENAKRTLDLYTHIYEIVHGHRPPTGEDWGDRRPEYDPALPLKERVNEKVRELSETDRPLTVRSIHRHLAAYRELGIAGLVDQRTQRSHVPGRDQDPRLIQLLEEEIVGMANKSTGTRKRSIKRVSVAAANSGIYVPSFPTLYRLLKELEKNHHPFGNATLRRTQANRPKRTYGRQTPYRPGEVVEIDSTKLDLLVIYPDGSTGRPELTTMIDVATRTITAAVLIPEATKGSDLAALVLARSLAPNVVQPGFAAERALNESILQPGLLMSEEELRILMAAKPIIYPESITIDRGANYIGSTFRQACDRLQISLVYSAPGTPTDKPHIERQFHDVHRGLIQYLDGYVGPNVVRRGDRVEQEARWTISQVQSFLDQWILAEWQTRPRKALAHPAMPTKALSPNEKYAALVGVSPTPVVTLTRDDYISLMPIVHRTIQEYGINFKGLTYDSPLLQPYRHQPSGLPSPAKDKWEVRYDPARMNVIFFRDHLKRRWIEVPWTLNSLVTAPFSFEVMKAAVQAAKKRDPHYQPADVLAELLRIQTTPENRTGHERKAVRRHPTLSVPEASEIDPDPAEEIEASEETVVVAPRREPRTFERGI